MDFSGIKQPFCYLMSCLTAPGKCCCLQKGCLMPEIIDNYNYKVGGRNEENEKLENYKVFWIIIVLIVYSVFMWRYCSGNGFTKGN